MARLSPASAGVAFEVRMISEASGLIKLLSGIEAALSPARLGAFLAGPVHQHLRKRAASRFRSEGDSATGRWAPLKPNTVLIRTNLGFGGAHPINRRTGEMERYVTGTAPDVSVSPIGAVLRFPGGMMGGSLLEKMGTAQSGKDYPLTEPRPVVALDESDLLFTLTGLGYWILSGGLKASA